jgi:hypothetical protein
LLYTLGNVQIFRKDLPLLASVLNGFRRIITCWKGLELRSSNTLYDITIGKALQVIAYKIKNMLKKYTKSHRVSKPLIKNPKNKIQKLFSVSPP